MSKSVKLASGRTFLSIKEARAHFDELRKATHPGVPLGGSDLADVLDIYRRYSKDWHDRIDAVSATTQMENSERSGGKYAPTKAFVVKSADGSRQFFSMTKALSEVAE